ncbi:MAG TPA: hypothetical protein PK765_05340 [bacterium]|nr:hypothetical protein [bacterium]
MEKAFRETLDPYGENANVVVLRFVENLKAAPAMGAGVIDGILDTTQSGIDLAIVPEKVVAGVRDFVKSVPQEEWKQALDELS